MPCSLRARRFDRGVQGQQIGLIRDVVDDADLLRDLIHRRHRLLHSLTALARFCRGPHGNAFGDTCVLGVLRDRGRHLFNRSARLFDARRLFARGLRQRLGSRADFFRRRREDDAALFASPITWTEPLQHVAHGEEHARLVTTLRRDIDREIARSDRMKNLRGISRLATELTQQRASDQHRNHRGSKQRRHRQSEHPLPARFEKSLQAMRADSSTSDSR